MFQFIVSKTNFRGRVSLTNTFCHISTELSVDLSEVTLFRYHQLLQYLQSDVTMCLGYANT